MKNKFAHRKLLYLCLALIFSMGFLQAAPFPTILNPQNGEVLLGIILIEGTSSIDQFESAELSFQFADEPTSPWFSISKSITPVNEGILGEWDTTPLADGNYHLKLEVFKTNGTSETAVVENLRIRNYSAVETSTPAPTLTPVPNATSTPQPTLPPPTPTQYPENPISVGLGDLQSMLLWGLLIGAFVFMGLRVLRSISQQG